jgi:hypothetical protein
MSVDGDKAIERDCPPISLQRQTSQSSAGFGVHSNTPLRSALYSAVDRVEKDNKSVGLPAICEGIESRENFVDPEQIVMQPSAKPSFTKRDSSRRFRNGSDISENSLLFDLSGSPKEQLSGDQNELPLTALSLQTVASIGKELAALEDKPLESVDVTAIQLKWECEDEETGLASRTLSRKKPSIIKNVMGLFMGGPLMSQRTRNVAKLMKSRLDEEQEEDSFSSDDEDDEESEMSDVPEDENLEAGDTLPAPSRLSIVNKKQSWFATSFMTRGSSELVFVESNSPTRTHKPWTHRKDGGINSRVRLHEHGDEIYYVYNLRKRTENLIKVYIYTLFRLSQCHNSLSCRDSPTIALLLVRWTLSPMRTDSFSFWMKISISITSGICYNKSLGGI